MARTLQTTLLMAAALCFTPAAFATEAGAEDDAVRARDDRIADLERKLEVVMGELARVRTQVAVPEEPYPRVNSKEEFSELFRKRPS